MSDDWKETLKQRVLTFVKQQEGYDSSKHENLTASCEDKNTFGVTYGDDIAVGIAGFGQSVELAFEDFVRSWKKLDGFTWIEEGRRK